MATPQQNFGWSAYKATWRLPIIVWQFLFFIGPLVLMIAMSFFLVKNYRMVEAFEMKNWVKMFGRDYFWDSYLSRQALRLPSRFPPMSADGQSSF